MASKKSSGATRQHYEMAVGKGASAPKTSKTQPFRKGGKVKKK